MVARNRTPGGFTLVELLVVVVIIGMLVGLMVPAVQRARMRARETQCVNYLKELNTALTNYDANKRRLPGSLNPVGNGKRTWVVELFPYIGRNDLWEAPDGWLVKVGPIVKVDTLACPLDAEAMTSQAPLSYVANANLFRDRTDTSAIKNISMSDLKAPAITILLSERVNTGNGPSPWATLDEERILFDWPTTDTTVDQLAQRDTGISSNHPGVNVALADGSVKTLSGDTDTGAYR